MNTDAPAIPSPWELILQLLEGAGRLALFLGRLIREIPPGLRYLRLTLEQCDYIGIGSLPLVFLTSLFVGAVASLQTSYQFQGAIPLVYVGTVVAKSVVIELGPVLTALVVGARVSSSIAAEIGTMRVTEQIDALETLAIRPIRFLAVPRFLATVLMLPLVTIFADAIAIFGGMAVAVSRIGISVTTFSRGMKMLFEVNDIYGGLIKSFVFGAVIAISGCFYGFHTANGAEGVGASTRKAVVASCVLILVADYFLAEVIFRLLFPPA
ncbi:MAG: ABC transporter permease [Candidatus Eisenbacteria bacterium]|uniref:ABC transporter permease n=1 Tax=Eiseniibacteriota bacterium TaxID=2212470 RepID=A0A956RQE9_UNCEI|nr:ABC transporter permease [Candidatus Eisenbacteria bacterium]